VKCGKSLEADTLATLQDQSYMRKYVQSLCKIYFSYYCVTYSPYTKTFYVKFVDLHKIHSIFCHLPISTKMNGFREYNLFYN
jgi:hypothetical protein